LGEGFIRIQPGIRATGSYVGFGPVAQVPEGFEHGVGAEIEAVPGMGSEESLAVGGQFLNDAAQPFADDGVVGGGEIFPDINIVSCFGFRAGNGPGRGDDGQVNDFVAVPVPVVPRFYQRSLEAHNKGLDCLVLEHLPREISG
jgi:hypothetical protein